MNAQSFIPCFRLTGVVPQLREDAQQLEQLIAQLAGYDTYAGRYILIIMRRQYIAAEINRLYIGYVVDMVKINTYN